MATVERKIVIRAGDTDAHSRMRARNWSPSVIQSALKLIEQGAPRVVVDEVSTVPNPVSFGYRIAATDDFDA